jgi:hypothetical protein
LKMSSEEKIRDHGLIIKANRLTIKKKTVKRLGLKEGDYWESETYGENKLLFTFTKTAKR